jgi:hypothetical protein
VIAQVCASRDIKRELIRGMWKESRRQLVFRGRRAISAAFSLKGPCHRFFFGVGAARDVLKHQAPRFGSGLWIVEIFLVYSRKPHRRHSTFVIAYCVCRTHFRRLRPQETTAPARVPPGRAPSWGRFLPDTRHLKLGQ